MAHLSEEEAAMTYIYDVIVKEHDVRPLKYVWRELQNDYDDRIDIIKKSCCSAHRLGTFLRDYPHLFVVENKKVSRNTEELESGQEKVDRYFEDELSSQSEPAKIETVKKRIEHAPNEVKKFIEMFYPSGEFERYLQGRPLSFVVSKAEGTVKLTKLECVAYFQRVMKNFETLPFTSLRGHVGQAPAHVTEYINTIYPGNEFRRFLEENPQAFKLRDNGLVTAAY